MTGAPSPAEVLIIFRSMPVEHTDRARSQANAANAGSTTQPPQALVSCGGRLGRAVDWPPGGCEFETGALRGGAFTGGASVSLSFD
jgi:hypothetical protein